MIISLFLQILHKNSLGVGRIPVDSKTFFAFGYYFAEAVAIFVIVIKINYVKDLFQKLYLVAGDAAEPRFSHLERTSESLAAQFRER